MKKSRRTFTSDFKAKVSLEAIKEIKTISELAQIYHVHPNLINQWKRAFLSGADKVFDSGKDEASEIKKLKKENQELVHQIGQLSVDINWLKKKGSVVPLDTRREMIDRKESPMSICHQCELPGIVRSSLYYTPSKAGEKELQLMGALDRLYCEDPTRGTRRMARELQKQGHQAGRHHVRTLMQIMRLKTVYCRPRTTIIDPVRHKYPYLLRNLEIKKPNQVWSLDISYIPMVRG